MYEERCTDTGNRRFVVRVLLASRDIVVRTHTRPVGVRRTLQFLARAMTMCLSSLNNGVTALDTGRDGIQVSCLPRPLRRCSTDPAVAA